MMDFCLHCTLRKINDTSPILKHFQGFEKCREESTVAQQIAFQSRPANVAIPPIIYLRPDIKFLVWFYFVHYVTYTLFFQET